MYITDTCSFEQQRFECDLCGAELAGRQGLERHRLIHAGVRPFQCDRCDQAFGQRIDLLRHYRRHTGSPNIVAY